MAIKDNLHNCELFFELTQKEIKYLVKNCAVEYFDKGQRLFKDGDVLDSLFVVLEGRCEIVKNLNTKIFQIQKLKQWEHFGEGLFCGQEKFEYDVLALENMSLLRIDFKGFQELFQKFPSAYGVLLNNLLRLENEKLKVSLGVIYRLYNESSSSVGVPLLGNRRLTNDEIFKLRRDKKLKKGA